MIENPWARLPFEPPYVLAEELEEIRRFNNKVGPKHKFYLEVDQLLPEAFIGSRSAPIVLLSNNPGYKDDISVKSRQEPWFVELLRKNLLHEPMDCPFLYLHPRFSGRGRLWWSRKLKHLVAKFGEEVIASSILNITYLPYPSHRFGHRCLRLPSQEYGFQLVREAVTRGAVIILMRPGKKDAWVEAVSELGRYDRFYSVNNPRNPTISPNNCAGYMEVVKAIEGFTGHARAERTGCHATGI